MTETTDVAWTIVVRIEDTDRWIDWSTGHRSVPEVLAAAELIVPISTIAEIRFDRITAARKRFSLADLGAPDAAAAPSAPSDRAALAAEAAVARVRSVLESEAVVGRSALDYRGLITSALMADGASGPSRMADEAQQDDSESLPLLFWDEPAGVVHEDGRITVWLSRAVNLAQSTPAGQLILRVESARTLRRALTTALNDADEPQQPDPCSGCRYVPCGNCQPDDEAQQAEVQGALLATRCDACRHTLNWHRNDVGCTVVLCVCGRFQQPAAVSQPDGEATQ